MYFILPFLCNTLFYSTIIDVYTSLINNCTHFCESQACILFNFYLSLLQQIWENISYLNQKEDHVSIRIL